MTLFCALALLVLSLVSPSPDVNRRVIHALRAAGFDAGISNAFATVATPRTPQAIVRDIQRADYEGDRAALRRLARELTPEAPDPVRVAKLRYWRGFALWRRALNGFNESAPRPEQLEDVTGALAEFDQAMRLDPAFADAKVAAMAVLGSLIYLNPDDPDRIRDYATRARQLAADVKALDPDSPRLAWVVGGARWYQTKKDDAEGQRRVFEIYEAGLAAARQRRAPTDVLVPSWGEPELLMSLAWAHLHKAEPDVASASRFAREALARVPYWHYVRDILLPQIADAGKQ